ncbi:MAG: CoA transferase [Deltaproteobacteria bacterium]|nr:CoA transferase [Deltaproteobacteria bacterium]
MRLPAKEELSSRKPLLRDVKVVDFGWAVVSPISATYLGFLGATVITVESSTRLNIIRQAGPYKDGIPHPDRSGYYTNYNTGKYSIVLDLKNPRGLEIGKKLIHWADVLVENFAPGVMGRLGLDYESVQGINPSIIYASTCQLGQTGPHAQFRGMGVQGAALAGLYPTTGWPGGDPVGPFGAYTDFVAPKFLVSAILAALLYRHHTGKGQYIEQSQVEAGMNFVGPALMDYIVNGSVLHCPGNREPNAAPHGAYRCQGEDRWCAIAVYTDQEWRAFCQAIGSPPWTNDEKFSTLLGRKENEAELDSLVEQWSLGHPAEYVMDLLQRAGVPAGVVATAEDLHKDPQLLHRQHYRRLNHPVIGLHSYEAPAFRFSNAPVFFERPAPCLGEHNQYICTEILDLTEEEYRSLEKDGVFR